MEITAAIVKELRDKTGAGMMECKKALSENDGDVEKAITWLREKGMASAQKKAGRAAKEGLVISSISDDARVGALVEVNCETDFVARTDDFKAMVSGIIATVMAAPVATLDELLAKPMATDPAQTVGGAVTATIAKLGENMHVKHFARFEASQGIVSSYIHAGGKVGVLVELAGAADDASKALAKDVAMQVAAVKPLYVKRDDVPADVLEHERAIYRTQAETSGKPEKVWDRIIDGKVEKYYEEVCLVDQPFIKDGNVKVKALLAKGSAEVKRFARFQVGVE